MPNIRVVFMGTPEFSIPCLEMLLQEGYDVAAVVTQPDRPKGRGQKLAPSPIKDFALAQGLNVLTPEKIRTPEFLAEISVLQPDIIVVVAFGQFLPKALLDLPAFGCINVHASLLPKYRGAAPIHWAIINGEIITGITTMYMDVGMDTGDMILKEELSIGCCETTGELHDKLKVMGARVLTQTLELIIHHQAVRIPQDTHMATYAPLLTRDIERIDWQQPASAIHNLVRGLNSWPGAYCRYKNKLLKIWRTTIHSPMADTSPPGSIINITANAVIVATGKGTLEISVIQPESKRRLPAREFATGYGLSIGELFE